MIRILVSECLYGEKIVRYDGKDYSLDDPRFQKWKDEGRLVKVCPEVLGGLPTPRPPAERKDGKIINNQGQDVTIEYTQGAEIALEIAKNNDINCALLKLNSPSCGNKLIYDGSFSGKKIDGQGLTTQMLRESGYKVFGEDDLDKIQKLIDDEE